MAGEAFMQGFNGFYYSFSPQVASYITAHSNLRPIMKILLYPLIGILYASSLLFSAISFNSELAVTITGILASLLIGAIYLAPLLTILTRLHKSSSKPPQLKALHVTILAASMSLAGLLLAELTHHPQLLEITTASTVLSYITLGGVAVSSSLTRIWPRRR
jgi:choline-glycine betaine transporter